MIDASDLSLVDVEFLQTVRDINNNPEKYPETDRGAVPANTASIKRATDMTDEQVSYRMGGNSNSRGFESGKHPLIKTHDAKPTDTGYSPRGVELTMAGSTTLAEAQRIGSRLEGVTKDEFNQLSRRLDRIEIKSEIRNSADHWDEYSHICRDAQQDEALVTTEVENIMVVLSEGDGKYTFTKYVDGDKTDEHEVDSDIDPYTIARYVVGYATPDVKPGW